MGRYVLGILAVVVVQIAFSIYVSYNTSNQPTTAAANLNVNNGRARSTKRHILAKSEPPFVVKKGIETETPKMADAVEDVPVDSRLDTKPTPARAESIVARTTSVAAPRRTLFRSRAPVDRASVERQYFGRMVVERTFWPAKTRPIRTNAIVKRQSFGRMVVERSSGV